MAMARRVESCPICCKVPGDITHGQLCGHEFCPGCILRWLRGSHTCPLCRRLVSIVSFSEQEEDCLQCIIRDSGQAASQAGNASGSSDGHSTRSPVASLVSGSQGTLSPAEQGAAGPEAVGGILPELWAELFRRRRNLLNPVRSWLQQWLQKMYRERWWQVKTAESSILLALCIFGPDREMLMQWLRPRLRHRSSLLVHGVLSIIETQCSQEVRRLRGRHAAQEETESAGASSGPSASPGDAPTSGGPPDSNVEHEAGESEEAPRRESKHICGDPCTARAALEGAQGGGSGCRAPDPSLGRDPSTVAS